MDWSLGNVLILLVVVVLGAVAGWLVMSRRSGEARSADGPAKPEATVAEELPDTATPDSPGMAVPDSETAQAEPASSTITQDEPVTAEPVTAEPPVVEPTVVEPVTVEPTVVEPVVEVPAVDVEPAVVEPSVAEPVAVEPVAPADPGPADDFRRIEGIGPKMAAALQLAGIRTYEQLGATDEAALRAAVRSAGVRATASLPTWPAKARELAATRSES
ncbi:hypothetical protein ACN27F_02165 [Solwaraspora sp. WMMB335]|uniref:hypothetical protein n=1 Tax=Solwaraspora sp. WMMB335 TaxID=3404118 RepID=UPI003B94A76D